MAHENNASGLVVSDELGLCVASRGAWGNGPAAAGYLQSVFEAARKLSDDREYPVVSIETSQAQILIAHADGFTTSVARKVAAAPAAAAAASSSAAAPGSGSPGGPGAVAPSSPGGTAAAAAGAHLPVGSLPTSSAPAGFQ